MESGRLKRTLLPSTLLIGIFGLRLFTACNGRRFMLDQKIPYLNYSSKGAHCYRSIQCATAMITH